MALSRMFFYGTLRHMPLLETVLGRAVPQGAIEPATLPGAHVTWVKDQVFPMIRLGTENSATGVIVRDLSAGDVERLDFYEGGFGYALIDVKTSAGSAKMYLPGPEVGPAGDDFDLADWERGWAAVSVEAATEVMRHFGLRSSAEVAAMFPAIRTRAGARLRARNAPPKGFQGQIDIQRRDMPYAAFFALDEFTLKAEQFEGGLTPPMKRAIFLGMDAAIVLPYDPKRDRVLLVEQLRIGPIGRGDPSAWQMEPIAGHVDPGETPQQAAHREAREEAGLHLRDLETVAECYPSPGTSSEFYYIYVGLCDLPDDSEGIGGLVSEGENIRSHLLSFDDFMEQIETQGFSVAPLILAGLWLARHRARLRSL